MCRHCVKQILYTITQKVLPDHTSTLDGKQIQTNFFCYNFFFFLFFCEHRNRMILYLRYDFWVGKNMPFVHDDITIRTDLFENSSSLDASRLVSGSPHATFDMTFGNHVGPELYYRTAVVEPPAFRTTRRVRKLYPFRRTPCTRVVVTASGVR